MIETSSAITLFLTGGGFALLCALFGVWLRSGWLARKLAAKKVTQGKVTP
jgi:hypothetical protein